MNGKHIVVSPHASFEMRRRGITLGEVTAVVRNPGQTVPSKKGREIRQSLVGMRGRLLLRVVVRETNVAYRVVTAYKTSKVSKYWIES